VDTEEGVGGGGLGCAVDVDGAAVVGLAGLVLGKGNVAVFLVAKGDGGAWCCLEAGGVICLGLGGLGRFAHQVGVEDGVDGSAVRGDEVDHGGI
jgi:hypothetical protein